MHFIRAREAKKVTVMLEVCLLVWQGLCDHVYQDCLWEVHVPWVRVLGDVPLKRPVPREDVPQCVTSMLMK